MVLSANKAQVQGPGGTGTVRGFRFDELVDDYGLEEAGS